MRVSLNTAINNKYYKYKAPSFKSEPVQTMPHYTEEEIRTAKLKKTISMLSVAVVSVGILYFGFKKCAKNIRMAEKQKELTDKLKAPKAPKIDKRVLDTMPYMS